MSGKKIRTEHSGGKNGGGFWGTRFEAKKLSRKLRRAMDKQEIRSVDSKDPRP